MATATAAPGAGTPRSAKVTTTYRIRLKGLWGRVVNNVKAFFQKAGRVLRGFGRGALAGSKVAAKGVWRGGTWTVGTVGSAVMWTAGLITNTASMGVIVLTLIALAIIFVALVGVGGVAHLGARWIYVPLRWMTFSKAKKERLGYSLRMYMDDRFPPLKVKWAEVRGDTVDGWEAAAERAAEEQTESKKHYVPSSPTAAKFAKFTENLGFTVEEEVEVDYSLLPPGFAEFFTAIDVNNEMRQHMLDSYKEQVEAGMDWKAFNAEGLSIEDRWWIYDHLRVESEATERSYWVGRMECLDLLRHNPTLDQIEDIMGHRGKHWALLYRTYKARVNDNTSGYGDFSMQAFREGFDTEHASLLVEYERVVAAYNEETAAASV